MTRDYASSSIKTPQLSGQFGPQDVEQELNALPRNSLILLASAQNLVTTGTRARLAQRVYEHKHQHNNHAAETNPRPHSAPAFAEAVEASAEIQRPMNNRTAPIRFSLFM